MADQGHAWLEVDSQATSAVGKIKNVDPERYKGIRFIPGPISDEFAANIPFIRDATKEVLSEAYTDYKAKWWPATLQSPEILTAASHALRSGALGLVAQRVFLSGLSQTGGVTRRFITHSSHLRLPNGSPPFEGFLPCQSGGEALPDVPGAKIIELVGEAEFQSVRFPCGIGGQMRGTAHRRPDSDTFRLYEVAFGGVRTVHSDAPLATFVAATPKGRPNLYWGSQWAFSPEKMQVIYKRVENYRLIAGRAIQKQIQQGFLLPVDAEVLRRETIEAVHF
ncbi:hypothetical protein MY5147_006736 [Beauveria neobassiana]